MPLETEIYRIATSHRLKKVPTYWRKSAESKFWNSPCEKVVEIRNVPAGFLSVDTEFREVLERIEQSRVITNLCDDWDGENSKSYSTETWARATTFLVRQAKAAYKNRVTIGIPRISPADNGSIDIFWKDKDRQLLINIPSDPTEAATYFGENSSGDTVSGFINTERARPDLLAWLNQQM